MEGHQQHSAIWHVQHFTMTETAAAVARGFGAGFGLEAVAFFRQVTTRIRFEDLDRRPIVVPDGDIHHRNETLVGQGDPWLMGVAGRRIGAWSAALRGGVAIPLGRTEENPFDLGRRGLPHQHIQFGTGTWDPLAGASLGRRFGAVMTSASVLARLPVSENRHRYRAGRRLQVTTSADRRLRGPWSAQAGLDYARETAETWSGRVEEEGNLGRSDLLLSAGIARRFGARVLILTAKVPLRTRSNGEQIDYPAILSVGWAGR
jgi:hypothetical protein